MVRQQAIPYVSQIVNGLNGESSLYQKTLNTCVDQASVTEIQQAYREYAEERYVKMIDQTLNQVLRNAVDRKVRSIPVQSIAAKSLDDKAETELSNALPAQQRSVRSVVIDLLIKAANPPEFYGNSRNYLYTVLGRMIEIEDQLAGVLTDQELMVIRNFLQQRMPMPQLRLRAINALQMQRIQQVQERKLPEQAQKFRVKAIQDQP